jgi:zinc finger protein
MKKSVDEKNSAKPAVKQEHPVATEDVIENEHCPFCNNKTLTLMDTTKEIPYFGTCYLFSMDCSSCGYHKADIELANQQEPCKYTVELSEDKDMSIRIVKSSFATIRIPHVGDIEPGATSNGYVTNVEGILNRMIKQLETIRDNEEEEDDSRKKAKNMIKKLHRVIWGQEKQKLIIEDPTGNSAIISDKAVKEKLKVKNVKELS